MIDSSFINEIVIVVNANTVLVQMSNGAYVYTGVPNEILAMFVVAESKGRFYNEFIKPKYPCVKIQ